MDKQLTRLKIDPEFQKEFTQKKKHALEHKDIEELYEVLDTILALELDEDAILDKIYATILEESFEFLANKISAQEALDIFKSKEVLYARAIYEHAIEHYDAKRLDKAKEIFLVLYHICNDANFKLAMKYHILVVLKEVKIDEFIEKYVSHEDIDPESLLSYFFVTFTPYAKKALEKEATRVDEAINSIEVSIQSS